MSLWKINIFRKAVSNLIVVAIGIMIILTTLIPLFIYLTSTRTDIERIIRIYEDFINLKELEKLSVETDYISSTSEMFYLRNTGSIPIKIVRSAIQDADGIHYYTLNILIDVGERIGLKQIFDQLNLPYDPAKLKYVVTARGSVYFIADQILRLTPGPQQGGNISLPSGGNPFVPQTSLFYWNFTAAIKNNKILSYYSESDDSCSTQGKAWVGRIANYDNNVLTINTTTNPSSTVTLSLKTNTKGCVSHVFKELLNLEGSYVVVIYYRIVISSLLPQLLQQNRVAVNISFYLLTTTGILLGSSVITFEWAPKSDADYLVYSGYTAIPVFQPSSGGVSGTADLIATVTLTQINGVGKYQVGIEYLAFQGVKVNPILVG